MFSYEELLSKYNILLKENKELKSQITELKTKLGMPIETEEVVVETSDTVINKYSSTTEKILLYRSLFCGREDVFARRWYIKTTEKSGYQPVCENEWADGLCDKRKYKCSVCPNRKLSPLTDKDIYKHLEGKDYYGKDVIGIYPMLVDETCHFLCADFDDKEYEKDVLAFCEICDELNIPAYIERSRSGGGAHIWVFFEVPIPAATARKLGSMILTKAMENRSELSFSSYDRLFPNQDNMPNGGFGNLIALPLQGQARKNDNSVFVDRNFKAYSDQWAYLSSIKKVSIKSVEKIVDTFSKNDILGTLVDESPEKPWESKQKTQLTSSDFPDKLEIVRSNMIYIPREGLSANAQNQIKRLTAFKNPDFYKSQAMRLPIYDKPRIICTADITDSYIGLPRGCEPALCDMLVDKVKNIDIIDKTNAGENIPVEFNGNLREEQELAVSELLKYNIGVLSATTAFGKTVIASYIVSQRKTNTLVLVHTQALMQQWKKSLEQFLTFDIIPPEPKKGRGRKKTWSPVGLLGAGKDTLNGIVDVAVMQSLVDGDEVKALVRNYGMIIVDECHHVSAVNFEKILKYANAKYVYGLTATPTRQDGHHPIIFMQCGPIRYRVDAKAQAEKRVFEHYLIPRFTSFRKIADDNITALYKKLSDDAMRNNLIVNDVVAAIKNGRTPIILSERREHVTMLTELLKPHCDNVIEIVGTTSVKSRRETLERLDNIPQEESLVVVATGRYVGEGFDYPRLDTLFLALPIAWKGKVAQYAGRLHRNYQGKTEVQVYDYIDIHVPVLERMYQKRVKSYSAIGYKTKITTSSNASPDLIYDGKTFYPVFCRDIEITQNEILIVSPFMRKARLTQMLKVLSPLIMNKVTVTVVTRPPEDFKDKNKQIVIDCTEQLKQYGIKLIYKSDFHQKFAIIDQYVVWYGSVNFLSFGTHEESIMRFENSNVAPQLPLDNSVIDQIYFLDELVDATTKLEVYKAKINDSKIDSSWFLPTLQQKEALASSKLEGTQATLDGVLINQVEPSTEDKNINEVMNYYLATQQGYDSLRKRDFTNEFFWDLHNTLMRGNVRKPSLVGEYRNEQNYIGRNDDTHAITFVPPAPDTVPELMNNLIDYINIPKDNFRPLIRTAIIHAQFETIHPFMDGNGRVGRMLIPMYLFAQKQIELPCFFISEALERDKPKYYTLLNNIREKNDWNEWIKFFLATVVKQCDKYIGIITDINNLYEKHLKTACDTARSSNMVDIINALYQYPITTAKQIAEITKIPMTSVNRYLTQLLESQVIYSDQKSRNRKFYCIDLLDILRL